MSPSSSRDLCAWWPPSFSSWAILALAASDPRVSSLNLLCRYLNPLRSNPARLAVPAIARSSSDRRPAGVAAVARVTAVAVSATVAIPAAAAVAERGNR